MAVTYDQMLTLLKLLKALAVKVWAQIVCAAAHVFCVARGKGTSTFKVGDMQHTYTAG